MRNYEINTEVQKTPNSNPLSNLCMDKKSESAIEKLTRYQTVSVFRHIMNCSINIVAHATTGIGVYRMPRLN